MELLFTMAHWHGLGKLRIHHDLILDELDGLTKTLGSKLRDFSQKTCPQFETKELQREYNARIRREAKQAERASRRPETSTEAQSVSLTLPHTGYTQPGVDSTEEQDSGERTNIAGSSSSTAGPTRARNKGRRSKSLNINTYKFHSYGDYAKTIRIYGTMDSYSTESVSFKR